MALFRHLKPQSLVGRIFALYAATFLVFTATALGLFYHYQFRQHIQEEIVAGEMMMNVAAPSVAEIVAVPAATAVTTPLMGAKAKTQLFMH